MYCGFQADFCPPPPFLIKIELKIEEEKGLHKYLTAAPSFLASAVTSGTARKNLIF